MNLVWMIPNTERKPIPTHEQIMILASKPIDSIVSSLTPSVLRCTAANIHRTVRNSTIRNVDEIKIVIEKKEKERKREKYRVTEENTWVE